MAESSFFTDLFNTFTNQQAVPQNTIKGTNETAGEAYATLLGQMPNVASYNKALTDIQLGTQGQIFGPAANQLQQGVYKNIFDELQLGGQVSDEMAEQSLIRSLEGLSGSGVGVSDAGRRLVARDFGLTSRDLKNQRTQQALQATNMLPLSRYSPDVQGMFTPQEISGDIRQVQAARDELANFTEDIRRGNFSSLINTGSRIAGTVVGGYYGAMTGNPIGGAQAGAAVGGSLHGRAGVAGYGGTGMKSAGGGGWMSMLGGGGQNAGTPVGGGIGGGGGRFQSGTGGRPDSVSAGSIPFNGAFMGSGPY